MRRPSQPIWYSGVVILVCILLLSVGGFVLLGRSAQEAKRAAAVAAQESERKWCSLVTTLDDAYRATPPRTPIGRRVADAIAALRRQFDCPPTS